eukprot:371768_1
MLTKKDLPANAKVFNYRGSHPSTASCRAFNAVLRSWKQSKWQKSITLMDALFTQYPLYYSALIGNYTHAVQIHTSKLMNKYVKTDKHGGLVISDYTLKQRTGQMDKSTFNHINGYFKRWLSTIKMCKKYDETSKHNYTYLINEALETYIPFLAIPHNPYRHKVTKYMLRYNPSPSKDPTGNIYSKLIFVHYCVRCSKLLAGLELLHQIKTLVTTTNINMSNAYNVHVGYYSAYIMLRLERFEEAKTIWNNIENKFNYEELKKILFENTTKDTTLHKIKQTAMLYLRNTSIYDLKIRYLIELKQFEEADQTQSFFFNLWGHEDQVHCYKGYLEFRRGTRMWWAKNLFDTVYMDEKVKKNQHYFCGLFYLYLEEYDHAKYHFLACIVDIKYYAYDLIVTEHYFYLSHTLMKLKEYKLSKHYLKIAHNMTPECPVIEKRYEMMILFLDEQLNEIQCGNTRCDRKYNYYCYKMNRMKTLNVCKGCGKSYYCNKKCQKLHWRSHKTTCDGTWTVLFDMLKTKRYVACPYHPRDISKTNQTLLANMLFNT